MYPFIFAIGTTADIYGAYTDTWHARWLWVILGVITFAALVRSIVEGE